MTEVAMRIDNPAANAVSDAFENKLCLCDGVTSPKSGTDEFQCVRIWGSDPTTGTQHPASGSPDVVLTADAVTVNPNQSVSWQANGSVPCRATAAPTSNNSSLIVQALWTSWDILDPDGNPTGYADPAIANAVHFKGKSVPSCGGEAEPALRANKAKGALSTDSVDREASGLDGEFLRYDQLQIADAASAALGFRLMASGVPVRASRIRVAAHRVEYFYGRGDLTFVHRPAGPTLVPSAEIVLGTGLPAFLFPKLPAWSLVIWQKASFRRHVLVSDNRNHPDVIGLDPQKDIFIQVNYDWRYLSRMGGSFGLLLDWN
jgi:hypothetical protein